MNENTDGQNPLILVTGASGYVGGRLLKHLSVLPYRLRAMARNPEDLKSRLDSAVDLVQGDVLLPESLSQALEGVHTAYYLIHSMSSGEDFEKKESDSARNFGQAAKAAGVSQIIFLGGLSDDRADLSPHMRSRHETGRLLRESGVPTLEFRASIILGAGSLSFEMIRALIQRLPIMITPKWTYVDAQPIYIDDLLRYLIEALSIKFDASCKYEIGGADVVSYKDIMSTFAEARGLKRRYLSVPVLSPHISSLWLGLVTPLFARIGRILIESVTHPSVVRDTKAKDVFKVEPCGVVSAVAQALEEEERGYAVTRWSDSLSAGNTYRTWAGVRFGTRLVDSRISISEASVEDVFSAVDRIGGTHGWYFANFLWGIRGVADELLGGVGMRRGRRDPENLMVGDVLDCWRVETVEPNKLLRLKAEMKLPGRAWLEFEVVAPTENSPTTSLRQSAVFDPKGLSGLLYWYGIYPLHVMIFKGMLRNILRFAEKPN